MDILSLMTHTAYTGTRTTGSYTLDCSTTGPAHDVSFTEIVPSITPFDCDSTVPALLPSGLSHTNFSAFDTQSVKNSGALGYYASKSLKNRDKTNTPTCLTKSLFGDAVYIAIVRHTFDESESDARKKIIWELGGDLENLQSVGRRLAAERILSGCNVVEFAMKQLNRPPLQAALVLGDLLGLRPEYCFETFPVVATATPSAGSIPTSSDLVPRNLMVDGKWCSLKGIDCQHDFSGNIDQAVCLYATEAGDLFSVIASRVVKNEVGVLTIGERAATAWPFSYTSMAKFPNAHVIFPLCELTSLHFRRLWREAKQPENAFIISGQFGDSAALYLDSFRRHPITLIPEFSRDGFLETLAFARRLLNAGALSVNIYPWSIQAEGLPDEMFWNTACSPWKQGLVQEGFATLDRVEVVSIFARRMAETAISPAKFEALLTELGLMNPPEPSQLALAEELHIPTLGELDKNGDDVDFEGDPSLGTLVLAGFILFIWGGSHSGKSFVLHNFIIGLATGQSAFCFENKGQPRVVGILDGELTPAQFRGRIEQLSANNPQKHLLKTNIRPLLARDPKVGSIDLLDTKFQERLVQTIKRLNIVVLAIDNIISVASKALKGREDELFSFFYRLERMGVAVIFINHATKDNEDFKGSVDLASKSQTIIQVEGRNVLKKKNEASDAVKTALANDGDAVVRLNYTKCKVPPRLNEKHEVYHLPVGETWRYIEGNVTDVEPFEPAEWCNEPECPVASLPCSEDTVELDADVTDTGVVHDDSAAVHSVGPENSLTHDKQRLYELFQADTTRLSRSDVEKALDWGEDKAGNELKGLKDLGLLKGTGSGRSCVYIKA